MSPIRHLRTSEEVVSSIRKLVQLDAPFLEVSAPRSVENNMIMKAQASFAPIVLNSEEKHLEIQNERDKTNNLNWDLVSSKFEISLKDAAKELMVGETTLKHWCRDNDISRWPRRKFSSIRNLMKTVKECPGSLGLEKIEVEPLIKRLEEEIQFLMMKSKSKISGDVQILVNKKHALAKIGWKSKKKNLNGN